MKLYCCFTPAHRVLFDDYFSPTVPSEFSVRANKLEIAGAGDFLSSEFLDCIRQKMELILRSIAENAGEVIVWSDVDIQCFRLTPAELVEHLGDRDIVFQREGKTVSDVNTGFFVCRCNASTTAFFQRVRDGLQENRATNEQYFINDLLSEPNPGITWGYLPLSFYARTHGWPPPRDLAIYHANATAGANGVQRKITQFRELAFLRRFGVLGLMITSLKHAPKRIFRVIRERLGRGAEG